MLVFNLSRVMTLRGVDRHYTYLVRQGFSPQTASALINNRVKQVKIAHLGRLCRLLQCTPNDLFEWQADADERTGEKHPLHSLRRENSAESLRASLNELPIDKMDQLQQIINDLKNEN